LVGQLSNPSVALAAVFEAAAVVRPGARKRRESVVVEPASGRLGNGVVQRAVVKVLATAQRPMCGQEVRRGVEALLGHPVSENSISSCLAYGVRRREPLFVRATRARYVLARSAANRCRTSIAGEQLWRRLSARTVPGGVRHVRTPLAT
jgi:hypothetical protein